MDLRRYHKVIMALMIGTVLAACDDLAKEMASSNSQGQLVKASVGEANVRRELLKELGPAMVEGRVVALPHFNYSELVSAGPQPHTYMTSVTDLSLHAEKPVFQYAPAAGEVSYSMVLRRSLALGASDDLCSQAQYSSAVPRFADVPKQEGAYYFCVRVTLGTQQLALPSPELIVLPVLVGSMAINGGAVTTDKTEVSLTLAAAAASQMYITNTAGCVTGGAWERVAASKTWVLEPNGKSASVYVIFRNELGARSECLKASIAYEKLSEVVSPPVADAAISFGATEHKFSVGGRVSITPTLVGSVSAVTITPALANGLSLDPVTGVISGTAASTLAPTSYTLTATNQFGRSGSTTLTIGIYAAPSISLASTTFSFSRNTPIASIVPTLGSAVSSVTIAPALPSGLSLNAATGVIAGTPTVASNPGVTYTLTAANAAGATATSSLSITVYDTPTIAVTGSPFSFTKDTPISSIVPTLGSAVSAVSISPALPSGLSFNTTSGAITGTPVVASAPAVTYTLTAVNAAGATASVNIAIAIYNPPGLTLTGSPFAFTKDSAITHITPSLSGSVSAVTISPALPSGLSLNATTGVISGTPLVNSTPAVSYTLTAVNAAGASAQASFSMVIYDPPSITVAGSPFTFQRTVAITNVTPSLGSAVTAVAVSPSLPSGLAFNTSTGVISGTASAVSSATSYTLTAQNAAGATASASISITVGDPLPTISYASSQYLYTTGDTVSITPATLGSSVTSVSVSPALSNGLSLNTSSGVISGTASGTLSATTYTLTATNSIGQTATASLDIGVYAAPTTPTISIAGGASYTTSASVNLSLSASNATEMLLTNSSSCSSGSWVSYATSASGWTLDQTNAVATVYVKYRNPAGAETSCVSDTITHDDTPPNAPSFTDGTVLSNGWNSPFMIWEAASDNASGISGYQIALGTTPGGTNTASWVSTTNTYHRFDGINLSTGTTYYGTLRVIDNAGHTTEVQGNGFQIKPWKQQAYLKAPNTGAGDAFGSAVGIDGDTVAVGAPGEGSVQTTITNGTTASTNDTTPGKGAAYVFKRTGTTWDQEAYLKASNANMNGQANYGYSVAIKGDTLGVGAWLEDGNQTTITNGTTAGTFNGSWQSGAVFVYKRTGVSWAQEAYLKPGNSLQYERFGSGLAMDNDQIAVGAYYESGTQTTITNGSSASTASSSGWKGAVYVYTRTGTSWAQQAYIKPPNLHEGMEFGWKVALSGDTLAVAARGEKSNSTSIINGTTTSTDQSFSLGGAVYIYRRNGVNWAQEAYIKPSNQSDWMRFASGVALQNNTLVVGASDDNGAGSVFVFQRSASTWAQKSRQTSGVWGWQYKLGESVAFDVDTIAAGMPGDDAAVTTITNSNGVSNDTNADVSGAVFIWRGGADRWGQDAYIKAPNNAANLLFGGAVAVSGSTLVVGATGDDASDTTITNGTTASADMNATDSGAVYIFAP